MLDYSELLCGGVGPCEVCDEHWWLVIFARFFEETGRYFDIDGVEVTGFEHNVLERAMQVRIDYVAEELLDSEVGCTGYLL